MAGVSGQSGLPAPGRVGQSQCPATGAAAVLSLRPEESRALVNRKCTVGSEFRSKDSIALSLLSVQVNGLCLAGRHINIVCQYFE